MNAQFEALMERQGAEFYQLALLSLIKRSGGTMAFSRADINEAHKLVGDVTVVGDKIIFKVIPRAANFDDVTAQRYFDEADEYATTRKQ